METRNVAILSVVIQEYESTKISLMKMYKGKERKKKGKGI